MRATYGQKAQIKWASLSLVVVAFFLSVVTTASAEQSVTLGWNPSPDRNVVGYVVYALAENSTTPTRIDAGVKTQAAVPGLKEGLRYKFTVTAYNSSGVESRPSEPLIYAVPVPLRLSAPSSSSALRRLQFPVAPGHWYELQASTDLTSWTTIWQTGLASVYSWVEFQDPQSVAFVRRYYRLQVH